METSLKKWRSGIRAVIFILKRCFDLSECERKGWIHPPAGGVLWSVITYKFIVMIQRVGGVRLILRNTG